MLPIKEDRLVHHIGLLPSLFLTSLTPEYQVLIDDSNKRECESSTETSEWIENQR